MGTELTKDMLDSLIEIGSSISISLLMALAILIIGRQLVKLILRLITVALEKSKNSKAWLGKRLLVMLIKSQNRKKLCQLKEK